MRFRYSKPMLQAWMKVGAFMWKERLIIGGRATAVRIWGRQMYIVNNTKEQLVETTYKMFYETANNSKNKILLKEGVKIIEIKFGIFPKFPCWLTERKFVVAYLKFYYFQINKEISWHGPVFSSALIVCLRLLALKLLKLWV